MITRFLTSVTAKFNPFSPGARTARTFLAMLPPTARADMAVDVKLLPRASPDPPSLVLGFRDGRKLDVDLARLRFKEVAEEVDRHSRLLKRAEELGG
ncbi:MAG: hypothetical protein INR71_13175 [Terriglobus roseus]|nr:hypothetical protein [Terriglobus roseus]